MARTLFKPLRAISESVPHGVQSFEQSLSVFIKNSLLTSVFLLLVILAGVSVATKMRLSALEDTIEAVGRDRLPKLRALGEINLGLAAVRAEELRAKIEGLSIRYGDGHPPRVTISAGVAAYPEGGSSLMEMLRVADDALYRPKQNGRNRVEMPGAAASHDEVIDKGVAALAEVLAEAGEHAPSSPAESAPERARRPERTAFLSRLQKNLRLRRALQVRPGRVHDQPLNGH